MSLIFIFHVLPPKQPQQRVWLFVITIGWKEGKGTDRTLQSGAQCLYVNAPYCVMSDDGQENKIVVI
jgi:hypothetical protein